jgi:hypothetical protein
MRSTPVPVLRELAPGLPVIRCPHCARLTLAHELCATPAEASECRLPQTLSQVVGVPMTIELQQVA